jgi:aspartate/tyrosine/aromatic aminotransferase
MRDRRQAELAAMADRIKAMRSALRGALEAAGAPGRWDHITSQARGRGGEAV